MSLEVYMPDDDGDEWFTSIMSDNSTAPEYNVRAGLTVHRVHVLTGIPHWQIREWLEGGLIKEDIFNPKRISKTAINAAHGFPSFTSELTLKDGRSVKDDDVHEVL